MVGAEVFGCHGLQLLGCGFGHLLEEFFGVVVVGAVLDVLNGHVCHAKGAVKYAHHIAEGAFKSVARALRQAVSVDASFADEIPSTKGVL